MNIHGTYGKQINMFNDLLTNRRKQMLVVYVALTIMTLVVYGQVYQFDFIQIDDPIFIKNSHVRSGMTLDGIAWAFSSLSIASSGFWHPLTWISLMLDYQLYGGNVGGYHVTNLMLHIFSTLMLFWLFQRMTKAIWRSAFVAALFALHPHHVESVAWIAERKDVLSAFFGMLTLVLYVHFTEKPDVKKYLLVVFSFLCALMSKTMAVTLPVIMILLDYWPLGRFQGGKRNFLLWQIREKISLLLLAAIFSTVQFSIWNNPSVKDIFSPGLRLTNALVAFLMYAGKILFPHDMHLFHPFSEQLPVWQIAVSVLIILMISTAVIVNVKRLPHLFVGWFWYTITVLPVIGITRNSVYWMHEHYTYLPSIGIGIMLAWGIPYALSRSHMSGRILFAAGIAALMFMAVISRQQCSYWKDSITLFQHSLKVTKHQYIAYYNLGNTYADLGQYHRAIYYYSHAIRLKPEYAESYYNRGLAYHRIGQYPHAVTDYSRAIILKSDYEDAYNNRGNIYGHHGKYPQAITDFNNVISLNPDHAKAYHNRGLAYGGIGQYQKSVEDFSKAIQLDPDYAGAYENRAGVYFKNGDIVRGCRDAENACARGQCKALDSAKRSGFCK